MTAVSAANTERATRIAALDGLRALAVLLVIAFHSGPSGVPGGFIGVDVFFVLSGFVITRKLLLERQKTGSISLPKFWFGRVARLIPASLVVIVATAVAFSLVATPVERFDVRSDGGASLWYSANWHFIIEARQYFQDSVDSSPFLHMWSLSVEEQFYIAWPLLLTGLFAIGWLRSSKRWWLGTLAVAATAWQVVASQALSFERVYYGTDTRAYQLLLGAVAADWLLRSGTDRLRVIVRRSGPLLAPIGLVAVLVAALVDGPDPLQRGWIAAVGALLLIVPLAEQRGGVVGDVLSLRPVVHIGDVSYGMYLWHWPIIVVAARLWIVGPAGLLALGAAGSYVLAHTSREILERPIIDWAKRQMGSPRRIRAGLLGAVGSLLVVLLLVLPVALGDRVPLLRARPADGLAGVAQDAPVLLTRTPVPPDLGRTPVEGFAADGVCINESIIDSSCRFNVAEGPTVLLVGDSHAGDLYPMMAQLAEQREFSLHAVIVAGCPWQTGLRYVEFDSDTCRDAQQALADLVDRLQPDIVVLASHPYLEPGFEIAGRTTPETDDQDLVDIVRAETAATISALGAPDRRLVVVEPRPSSPFDPPSCLSGATILEECAFLAGSQSVTEAIMLRELATELGTFSTVDLLDLVCPRYPVCDPIIEGTLVRYDRDHLYAGFAQSIGATFAERAELPEPGSP